jgi:geranylgeranyl pyrophosphate synthase
MDLARALAAERTRIDAALGALLPREDAWPQRLHRAMRYAVLGGGKRLRPILMRVACRAAGGDENAVIEAACALEMVHTYSLVHDDLPAMDDDTLRRGRATLHVAFDEATAILAGDALLAEGFAVLARYPEGEVFAIRRALACAALARAVGSAGMVGGQMEDLEAAGETPDAERLDRIHRAKTGALLSASMEIGALLAGASEGCCARLAAFGARLGLAFQIADDILDVTGSAESLGKSPGKDAAADKLTYPRVYGLAAAHARLAELAAELAHAAAAIEGLDGMLGALAMYVAERDR